MKLDEPIELTIERLKSAPFKTGDVLVNVSQNTIQRNGETYTLQPKVLELLVLLVCANGATISKEEITANLWPEVVVGPDSLANCMARLRKALNDDAKSPAYIQTVQRKGYRWLPSVELTNEQTRHNLYAKRIVLMCALFGIFAVGYFIYPNTFKQETFPFPDLAIKKLPDGGYEIQAGIEGKLTEERKAALLKEIKRITGEEHSDMEFTFDTLVPTCPPVIEGKKDEKDCVASEAQKD
ncbi:winged helix-turn-helix domain-containing protein [Alteromonas facilis]|uniref:winged helix-turn-helix domain-containing protein n=1 Tax=Alteromonas facilis TaxID=2048004 RepID=UPI000C2958D0|nr:winged helix-turn-helix domain-containing protein [Alteromonas facilis]